MAEEEEEEGGKGEKGGFREEARFGEKGFREETEMEDGRREEDVTGSGGVGVVSRGGGGDEPAAGVWRINSQVNGTGAHLEANIHFNIVK